MVQKKRDPSLMDMMKAGAAASAVINLDKIKEAQEKSAREAEYARHEHNTAMAEQKEAMDETNSHLRVLSEKQDKVREIEEERLHIARAEDERKRKDRDVANVEKITSLGLGIRAGQFPFAEKISVALTVSLSEACDMLRAAAKEKSVSYIFEKNSLQSPHSTLSSIAKIYGVDINGAIDILTAELCNQVLGTSKVDNILTTVAVRAAAQRSRSGTAPRQGEIEDDGTDESSVERDEYEKAWSQREHYFKSLPDHDAVALAKGVFIFTAFTAVLTLVLNKMTGIDPGPAIGFAAVLSAIATVLLSAFYVADSGAVGKAHTFKNKEVRRIVRNLGIISRFNAEKASFKNALSESVNSLDFNLASALLFGFEKNHNKIAPKWLETEEALLKRWASKGNLQAFIFLKAMGCSISKGHAVKRAIIENISKFKQPNLAAKLLGVLTSEELLRCAKFIEGPDFVRLAESAGEMLPDCNSRLKLISQLVDKGLGESTGPLIALTLARLSQASENEQTQAISALSALISRCDNKPEEAAYLIAA